MGKRNSIVVLSSDDEGNLSCYNSKSSRPPVPRKGTKGSKKARLLDSSSERCTDSSKIDQFRSFYDELNEDFTGFKVSSGSKMGNVKELWVDKYKPRSLEELAVHKKKVDEVKVWFDERLRSTRVKEDLNHVVIITGPSGVGKSATIHVIASHLGATLCEWNTPTPTIWQEHLHNSNSGIRYTSKLDEFEIFVDRVRKYGLLSTKSESSIILLIDDLPMTKGKFGYGRLQRCLHFLVRSTQIPTAILITDYGKADSPESNTLRLEELQSSLASVGASKVAFNPVTINSIKATLSRICRQEQCNVSAEQVDVIAKTSGGDIRHAIMSLQYLSLKPETMASLSCPVYSKEKSEGCHSYDNGFCLPFGRDESLTLFHALGKFLHNKRAADNSSSLNGFPLRAKFSRLPIKMDSPERILSQAHGQARPVADFLHENVLDFLSEEAINDAYVVASYLSDADLLLAGLRGMITKSYEAESLLQPAAASVAARGVLFGNSHPLPSRWHVVRRPKLWQVEQLSIRNNYEIMRQKIANTGPSSSDVSVIATEYRPVLKWLGFRAETSGASQASVNETAEDGFETMSLDNHHMESSDDEIEEW